MTNADNDGTLKLQEVFYLDGIPYLPHYTVRDAFVGPRKLGTPLKYLTRVQLIKRGAIARQMALWPRRYND
jgi:hypothetical protein